MKILIELTAIQIQYWINEQVSKFPRIDQNLFSTNFSNYNFIEFGNIYFIFKKASHAINFQNYYVTIFLKLDNTASISIIKA